MQPSQTEQDKDLRQRLSTEHEGGMSSTMNKANVADLIVEDDQESMVPDVMVQNEAQQTADNSPIEPDQNGNEQTFNLCTGIYCLLLFSLSACTTLWTKGAMAQFYGFGVEGKSDDPFYSMKLVVIGLNAQSYAQYVGLWFTITFIPCLLLGGPLIEGYKKTNVLGWCTAISGVVTVMHAMVTHAWQAQILIALAGLF